ncbi:MAG: hypothetical protein H6914_09735 [Novosphingobium sp.]|nr:hypothetical protein [Novosphingobium sp.]
MMPLYLWIASGLDLFREPILVALVAVIALMISNMATLSWTRRLCRAAMSGWRCWRCLVWLAALLGPSRGDWPASA